ncbi:uncharacterized protein LOC133202547 [Saccostrea echinata]|uniref:uncharacterized protein LOC133202547 n=1 Tax=Saccostrea echinata TaxID=191078 RepID=UPI002A818859|nr:uncharacterized protein LOC133202547 [Saccostrea echinata]
MKKIIVTILLGLCMIGDCATPLKAMKKRLTQEQCKQKVAGMKTRSQSSYVSVNPTCDLGKVSVMYSRSELQLSFWRDYPYQICLVELKRYEVLRAWDASRQQIQPIRDGNNVCFQNRNPNGGTVNVLLKPSGFTYISEVYYEIQRLQTSGSFSAVSPSRDQRPLPITTPLPERRFRLFRDVITPVPRLRDLRMRRPVVFPSPVPSPSPLPLSRRWFLGQLPRFTNRMRGDVRRLRGNNMQERDNIRFRQGLQRFFGQ